MTRYLVTTTILMCAVPTWAAAGSATLTTADKARTLRLHHRSVTGGLPLRVLDLPSGLTAGVSGWFPITARVGADGRFDREALEGEARSFIVRHRKALGLDAGFDPSAQLQFTELRQGAREAVLEARQLADGIRVRGRELAFVFSTAGYLLAVNGTLQPTTRYVRDRDFSLADAMDALEKTGITLGDGPDWTESPKGAVWRTQRSEDEPVIDLWEEADPESGTIQWVASDSAYEYVIDTFEREVVRQVLLGDGAPVSVNRLVTTVRTDVTGDDWRTRICSDGPADCIPNHETVDVSIPVWRETYATNFCGYRLESFRPEYAHWNGIDPHVADQDSGEHTPMGNICTATTYNAQSCPFRFDCEATFGDGSHFRQQAYYQLLRKGLTTMESDGFSIWPVTYLDAVSLRTDLTPGSIPGCDPAWTGCYLWSSVPWARTIHLFESRGPSPATVWHEMGHYINWSYGGLGDSCGTGDESNALDESVSNALAGLLGRGNGLSVVRYDNKGIVHMSADPPTVFVGAPSACGLDEHDMGVAFEEAVWELTFDVDCTQTNCIDGMDGMQGDIGWATPSDSYHQLIRAIAYAAFTTPSATTFDAFVNMMLTYLALYQGGPGPGSIFQNARSVFMHHGFLD